MFAERKSLAVRTDGDGNATGFVDVAHGSVLSVSYEKHGSNPFADTVDFAITVEGTGEGIWTEQNITATTSRRPLAPAHAVDGTPALLADAGEPVLVPIVVANDRIEVVVSNGGADNDGTFHFIIG